MTLGQRLKAIRLARELTQTQLADLIGVSQARYSNWELDKRNPRLQELNKLCRVLKIPHDELIGANYLVNLTTNQDAQRYVPVVRWSSLSGRRRPLQTQPEEQVPITAEATQSAYALVVEGDTMEPDFPAGCRIVVDPEREPRSGDFVVVQFTGHNQPTLKQYVRDGSALYFKPTNPRYPVLQDDDATILGVVVEAIYHRRF